MSGKSGSSFLMVRSANLRVSKHEARIGPIILRDAACAAPRDEDHTPPILQTSFHSSALTGCTERREYFTSAISASFFSALIATMVTGVFKGLSALMSTQTNFPLPSVGSG